MTFKPLIMGNTFSLKSIYKNRLIESEHIIADLKSKQLLYKKHSQLWKFLEYNIIQQTKISEELRSHL